MTLYLNDNFLESREFLFHAETCPVGSEVALHAHQFVEFVYIAEGEGEHDYRGSTYRVGQGDVFIIEPNIEHGYRVAGGKRLLVYNVLFDPAVFTAELQALSELTSFVDFFYVEPFLRSSQAFGSKLTLSPREQLELRESLDRLIREYVRKESGYRFLIKTKLIEIFIVLSRIYKNSRNKPLASISSSEVMEQIGAFIRLHHAQPLTLEQMSQLCGISQSSFTAKFKEAYGKTFLEYRNDVRIGVACRLLADTSDKVIAVAHEVGFEDVSHFNRAFKQVMGVTPRQYRLANRREPRTGS